MLDKKNHTKKVILLLHEFDLMNEPPEDSLMPDHNTRCLRNANINICPHMSAPSHDSCRNAVVLQSRCANQVANKSVPQLVLQYSS